MKIPARINVNISKKIGKILLTTIFIFALSLIITNDTQAQNFSNANIKYQSINTEESYNTNPDVPLNLHNVVQILTIDILSAVSCQISGIDPTNPEAKCLGVDPESGKVGFVENSGGAIVAIGKLIDLTLAPPASSTQYIAYLKSNFGITQKAYAQEVNTCASGVPNGVGFCSLLPILPLWVSIRNIVYLILILLFVVIGVGIMLRIHIDPRTVMTIQNQIPKIVVGIILITFSYAIAGFLIDVMWVAIYLFATVIVSATTLDPGVMENIVTAGNPFVAANEVYAGGIIPLSQTVGAAFSSLVINSINGIDLGILTEPINIILSILATIIIFIAIIVALLRLWIMLVITYINIILDIIFAPFWLLVGILPGSPGIGAWFRDIISNLAVFPVAVAFFMLGSYFISAFNSQTPVQLPDGSYVTIQGLTPPILGGSNSQAIAALIGLGFILMLPNLLSTIKAALKAPKLNFGNMMDPVRVGFGGIGRITRGAQGYMGGAKYELTDEGTKPISRKARVGRAFGVIK